MKVDRAVEAGRNSKTVEAVAAGEEAVRNAPTIGGHGEMDGGVPTTSAGVERGREDGRGGYDVRLLLLTSDANTV